MINIKKIEDEVKTSVTVERELTIVFKVVEFFVIWLILWYVNMKYLISKHFCHCDFWSVGYRKICINNILDFANISNISNSFRFFPISNLYSWIFFIVQNVKNFRNILLKLIRSNVYSNIADYCGLKARLISSAPYPELFLLLGKLSVNSKKNP